MLVELRGDVRDIHLIASPRIKLGSTVQVVEKMFVRILTTGYIFGERLELIQVTIGGSCLIQASFHHRKLVITRRRVAANFNVFSEQLCRLCEMFSGDAKVSQLQQRVTIVRVQAQNLLKLRFGPRGITLPLRN